MRMKRINSKKSHVFPLFVSSPTLLRTSCCLLPYGIWIPFIKEPGGWFHIGAVCFWTCCESCQSWQGRWSQPDNNLKLKLFKQYLNYTVRIGFGIIFMICYDTNAPFHGSLIWHCDFTWHLIRPDCTSLWLLTWTGCSYHNSKSIGFHVQVKFIKTSVLAIIRKASIMN